MCIMATITITNTSTNEKRSTRLKKVSDCGEASCIYSDQHPENKKS